jgi:hypothetical protein
LNWLSRDSYEGTHEAIHSKKHEGTADWLRALPEYKEWFASDQSAILWCYGGPGMDKSVLAANTLEHILATRPVDEQHGIVFMYYDYRRSEEQDSTHVIRVLLKQLCRGRAKPPDYLQQLKKESRRIGSQDDFLAVLKDYEQLHLVVDGLDECPKTYRAQMVGTFKAAMSSSSKVKILLTRRYETDLSDGLDSNNVQSLALGPFANKFDINTFIPREVEALRTGGNSHRLRIGSDDLVEEVIRHLRQGANGLYVPTLLEDSSSG